MRRGRPRVSHMRILQPIYPFPYFATCTRRHISCGGGAVVHRDLFQVNVCAKYVTNQISIIAHLETNH